MYKKVSSDENFKILENLPGDLKDILFLPDTADHIGNVCEKFKVPGEKISLVAKTIGEVLSKTLPLENFQEALEKEAGLEKNIAKNVSDEINFRIFSQVRESLAPAVPKAQPEEKVSSRPPEERRPKGSDFYREPIK